jgi:hypothetical protein
MDQEKGADYGMIEQEDGKMTLVPFEDITFTDREIPSA